MNEVGSLGSALSLWDGLRPLDVPKCNTSGSGFAALVVCLQWDESPPPEPLYPLLCSGRQ